MATVDINCLLKIGDTQEFSKFLHVCVDDMIGKKVNFEKYNSDIEWTKDELKKAQLLIQANFKSNILNNDGEFRFPFDNVGEHLQDVIQKCYELRKDEIQQHLKRENLLSKNIPLVENIDWKLKWVVGSSSLATISQPLLQVDLHSAVFNEVKRKHINFEMTLEQVEELINKLEELRKNLTSKK